MLLKLEHVDSGNIFDWGKTSEDYAKYRDVYPDVFYQKLLELGLCKKGSTVLDLGTGTGILPRHLAGYGVKFIGVDISENQITQARKLSEGMDIEYIVSAAEDINFPDDTFDNALACQCFIYFNQKLLLPKLYRTLKTDGRFCVLALIWLPGESKIAAGTEEFVLKHNPSWNGAGYTRPDFDLNGVPSGFNIDTSLGFIVDSAFAFDVQIPFTQETWHGRIKACRGIGASALTPNQIAAFEREHLLFLKEQPESFEIPHSANFCVLRKR
jgi:SAM-dependent methyltransferase